MRLKRLDFYIIQQYLSTFFFTMMLISLIAVTINYFEQVDRFLNSGLSFGRILKDYYVHFLPWINGLLWPLFALLAVIFFTSRLARNSEVISILASGVSYERFLVPYIIAGLFLSSLLWIGNNYIIPISSKHKNEFESEFIRKNNKRALSSDIHFFIGPNEKVFFRIYSDRDSSARNFRLERFEEGRLVGIIKSNGLKFVGEPNKWQMDDYEYRSFRGDVETLQLHKFEKKDTTFPFHPSDFVRYTRQMDIMTTGDLRAYIAAEQARGIGTAKSFYIELYRRTADPFTILILTIIGVCVASRKVRGGLGFHLAAGVIIGAIFVIISKFTVTMAANLDLHPVIGVWIPNLIFSGIAFILYRGAQK